MMGVRRRSRGLAGRSAWGEVNQRRERRDFFGARSAGRRARVGRTQGRGTPSCRSRPEGDGRCRPGLNARRTVRFRLAWGEWKSFVSSGEVSSNLSSSGGALDVIEDYVL